MRVAVGFVTITLLQIFWQEFIENRSLFDAYDKKSSWFLWTVHSQDVSPVAHFLKDIALNAQNYIN